mgnify:CR=1 FL=1
MGSGYYAALTQWSKGEYANANNTQDDLAIISANGAVQKTDDCGNTRGDSCGFAYSNNTVHASGIIEGSGDVDMREFITESGTVSFEVTTSEISPNLNMRVQLLDSAGNVVVAAPDSTEFAVIDATIPAGTYYLSVEGVGSGDPSDLGYSNYGSLGQYNINGSILYSGQVPPVANDSGVPSQGSAPLVVTFSSDGSVDPDGVIASYRWDFGDGTASSEADPVKTYTETGLFTAVLTVTDSDGFSDSVSVEVSVTNAPPVAVLDASVLSGDVPLEVSFDANESYDNGGSIASYRWDFGDGSEGVGDTVTHTYMTAGEYVAQLTVTDNEGASASDAIIVEVVDPYTVNAPTDLSVSVSGSDVTLDWVDNANNETVYNVYRALEVKKATPVYELVGTADEDMTAFTDVVIIGGTYLYRVAAYRLESDVYSDYSDTVKARVKDVSSTDDDSPSTKYC